MDGKAWSDYMVGYRASRKARKLCGICGKSDERTRGGKSVCAACAEARAAYDKERYPRRTERLRETQRARRERLIAAHRCTDCGGELPQGWKTLCCLACSLKRAEQRERRRAEE